MYMYAQDQNFWYQQTILTTSWFVMLAFLYSKIQTRRQFFFFCQERRLWRRIMGKEAGGFQESEIELNGWWPKNDFIAGYGIFSLSTQEAQPGGLIPAPNRCRPHSEIQARKEDIAGFCLKTKIQRRKEKHFLKSPPGRAWTGDSHARRGHGDQLQKLQSKHTPHSWDLDG